MKILATIALALLAAGRASAQTPKSTPPKHADLTDQRMCYQQARTVVAHLKSEAKEFAVQQHKADKEDIDFDGAHYDSASKTCFVKWSQVMVIGTVHLTYFVEVDDAFEGKEIAAISGQLAEATPPTICHVNGKLCSSREEFDKLLWNFIPAFRPLI